MDPADESTGNAATARRHLRARWLAVAIVVVLFGLGMWLGSTSVSREEVSGCGRVQEDIEASLRVADSLLRVGDRDHDTPDIAYSGARLAIARADSLAAVAGLSPVDSLLRVRADNSVRAAKAALLAKADLFSDLPRLAADIDARIKTLDSLMSKFAIE